MRDALLTRAFYAYHRFFARLYSGDPLHLDRLHREDPAGWRMAIVAHEQRGAERIFEALGGPPPSGSRGLEVGCGLGGLAVWLGRRGVSVVATERDPNFVERAREIVAAAGVSALVDVQAAADGRLPWPDRTFDFVVSYDVVEHLEDPGLMLGEMHRVLRPGGSCYLWFGPLWRHPKGAHLPDAFPGPWSHLIFPERIVVREVCRVRGRRMRHTYAELGLARMTVAQFRRLLAAVPFEVVQLEITGVRGLHRLARLPIVGELAASTVRARLRRRPEASTGETRPLAS